MIPNVKGKYGAWRTAFLWVDAILQNYKEWRSSPGWSLVNDKWLVQEEDKAKSGGVKKRGSVKRRNSSKRPNGEAPSIAAQKAKMTSEKLQDEIIMLHEAYQFLMKKYK